MIEYQLVTDVYNKIGDHFNQTRGYQWSWINTFINSFPKDTLIIDIGCGSGRNMLVKGYKFIGIDNSEKFIQICEDKGLNVIQNDMTNINLPDNYCKAIISIASFHHLSNLQRRIQCLNEMYRILKPGGRILISVWSINQPDKTRRKFDNYGDTIVPWNNNRGEIYQRYYYIFKVVEIKALFILTGFHIINHIWDCGNEIFELTK